MKNRSSHEETAIRMEMQVPLVFAARAPTCDPRVEKECEDSVVMFLLFLLDLATASGALS